MSSTIYIGQPMTFMKLYGLIVIVCVLVICLAAPANAQDQTLTPKAQEAYRNGIIAAQNKDYRLAVRFFRNAAKAKLKSTDYNPWPQVWFNLGLAASHVPDNELRAVAALNNYLSDVPHAANAKAVRAQLVHLEHSFEARVLKQIDTLDASAESLSIEAPILASIIRMDDAATRAFMGDTRSARSVISEEVDGKSRLKKLSDDFTAALVSTDMPGFSATILKFGAENTIRFALERGKFDLAFHLFTTNPTSPPNRVAEGLMCDATVRDDKREVKQVISYITSNLPRLIKDNSYDYSFADEAKREYIAEFILSLGYENAADVIARSLTSATALKRWSANKTILLKQSEDDVMATLCRYAQGPWSAWGPANRAWWGPSRDAFLRDVAVSNDERLGESLGDVIKVAKSMGSQSGEVISSVAYAVEGYAELYRMIHGPFAK